MRVAVVGGGIAGLAAAFEMASPADPSAEPLDVTLLEAGERVGGNIRTEERDGFRIEWAVNGFLDSAPDTPALADRLGLTPRLAPADPAAARRYILCGGRLVAIPTSPIAFLRSPILSLGGRLRVFAEPFARPAPRGVDESVHDFAARRIGAEAARVLVDAMVSGVFAGDARTLSLASAFPTMRAMEAEHGGLVRAMIAKQRAARRARAAAGAGAGGAAAPASPRGGPAGPGGRLTSFRGGMEELPRALATRLGGRVRLGARVAAVEASSGALRLRLASGEIETFDLVLLACPPGEAAAQVARLDPDLSALLAGIPSAPVAVVALGFRLADVAGRLDGFGFLVPRSEGVRALGALFDSNIFPERAPEGRALVRVLAGGSRDPDAVALDDGALVALARGLLAQACGVTEPPVLERVIRHRLGIPQYVQGHAARLGAIESRLARHRGLWLAGNAYDGISVNACVAAVPRLAASLRAAAASPRSGVAARERC